MPYRRLLARMGLRTSSPRQLRILGKHHYWFLAMPALIIIFIGMVLPLVYTLYLSLRNFDLMNGKNEFTGFGNYVKAITDSGFIDSMGRTILYVGIVIILDFVIGFSQALLVYVLKPKIGRILKILFLMPILLMPTAAAMFWRVIMYGPPNQIFNHLLGINLSFAMLSSPKSAFIGIIITVVWAWSPLVFLLLSGGLSSLPNEPLEAAKIDGCNFRQTTIYHIIPMLKPIIIITISLKAVESFLSFPFPWVMTQGGPANSTHLLSTYIYDNSFNHLNYGYGAAMSIIMMVIGLILSSGVIYYVWRNQQSE